MTFELAWKVLKDFLEAEGYTVIGPRDAIKLAFQSGILDDGHVWLEALKDRNPTVHTYEATLALAVKQKIKTTYFPVLKKFSNQFELRESNGLRVIHR